MKISIIITSLILLAGSAVAQHDHGAGHTNAPRHSKKRNCPLAPRSARISNATP